MPALRQPHAAVREAARNVKHGKAVNYALLKDRRRLRLVLLLACGYFIAELAGGFYANSLALISDAVHMLTDIASICLALITLWIASRPATRNKTYGYVRAEILGALFNGLLLGLIGCFIILGAIERLRNPAHVMGSGMMLIAAVGLGVNLIAALLTRTKAGEEGSFAVRAVFLHVFFDLLGSLGVLSAGAVVYFTGWTRADALVGIFIGSLVLYGSWGLVREGVDILMEAVPGRIDLDELRGELLAVPGAVELHDLHVWCLSQRELALSAHAVVEEAADPDRILADMSKVLEHKFNFRHITLQLERCNRINCQISH
jgi:cobalt-zinc-cadmium efflux system protein